MNFTPLLVKLRILDAEQTLDLTAIMMAVLIVKVAASAALDWGVISALFLGLANYNAKKWYSRDKVKKAVKDQERLGKMEAEIKSLVQASNLRNMGR